jgi:hypothetical protein
VPEVSKFKESLATPVAEPKVIELKAIVPNALRLIVPPLLLLDEELRVSARILPLGAAIVMFPPLVDKEVVSRFPVVMVSLEGVLMPLEVREISPALVDEFVGDVLIVALVVLILPSVFKVKFPPSVVILLGSVKSLLRNKLRLLPLVLRALENSTVPMRSFSLPKFKLVLLRVRALSLTVLGVSMLKGSLAIPVVEPKVAEFKIISLAAFRLMAPPRLLLEELLRVPVWMPPVVEVKEIVPALTNGFAGDGEVVIDAALVSILPIALTSKLPPAVDIALGRTKPLDKTKLMSPPPVFVFRMLEKSMFPKRTFPKLLSILPNFRSTPFDCRGVFRLKRPGVITVRGSLATPVVEPKVMELEVIFPDAVRLTPPPLPVCEDELRVPVPILPLGAAIEISPPLVAEDLVSILPVVMLPLDVRETAPALSEAIVGNVLIDAALVLILPSVLTKKLPPSVDMSLEKVKSLDKNKLTLPPPVLVLRKLSGRVARRTSSVPKFISAPWGLKAPAGKSISPEVLMLKEPLDTPVVDPKKMESTLMFPKAAKEIFPP